MLHEPLTLERMVASLAERTRRYLTDEMAVGVSEIGVAGDSGGPVTLEHLTAVLGIGGPSGILVAFSYSPPLAEALFRRTVAGLGLAPGEEAEFRDASLTEIANVIAGNWIADFSRPGERITMTPPVIVEGAQRIHHVPHATFRSLRAQTEEGPLWIHLIGPQNMFDRYLNAV